jgi:D-alanyl-D-alanine carboxypeptidase/D-alanyl-D-alanine-endopeptidase (penicillin-binding protein 4)
VRGTRITALITLAMLNVFTLAAGVTVARMLPPRLAALRVPVAAARPAVRAGTVLAPAGGPAGASGAGGAGETSALPTATGLSAMVAATLPGAEVGPGLGVEVADARTGEVLYSDNGATLATPASTTKLATAVTALAVLGPDARLRTSVRQVHGGIVLVGGGDPTLAVNSYPSSDYPRPATLAALAASTARALKAEGRGSVQLGYDTSLYSGPGMAPGWSDSDVNTGNVTPIVALEADQGRLTASGALEDSDDPLNFRPRTMDPAGLTASAFADLLRRDGITITSGPSPATAPKSAPTLASVSSPPLSAIAEQMLQESNNVIAENLARQTAIAMGLPATFAGAADAVMTELRRLGVTTPISLVDGSGLSPQDGIAPETLVRVIEVAVGSPRLRMAVAGLPVAGFTGTLSAGGSVFGGIGGAARGVVRAKTGNLNTVATLAGLAYDRSGRLLIFAIMAPKIPGTMLQTAADAIDSAAAGLADCGCRLSRGDDPPEPPGCAVARLCAGGSAWGLIGCYCRGGDPPEPPGCAVARLCAGCLLLLAGSCCQLCHYLRPARTVGG